ncbi:glycine betaine ABC transporter substrate-binding protein [Nocardioides nanhaiensis]|uniref:Glycine betaine ABC transporter substrate-binding protein n=1 Tax=Nocardioides nanhaiensis TaxID=1476871 RepID=A0ABP8W6C9_9ACTN
MHTRKVLAASGALIMTLGLAACGGDDGGGGGGGGDTAGLLDGASITVGSKDFDEQLILGNISKLALENAGADVTDQINTGGTDVARAALVNGEIDTYWEYNGTAWISFFQETEPIADRIEQYEVVRDRDLEENDLHWLAPADFNNTYALAYQADAADDLGNPETLSDLATLIEEDPDAATLCVESEFSARDDGLPGMEATYGYQFPSDNVTVLDTAIVYSAAAEGDPCNFGEVFTSDGRVSALDLVVLEDDEGFFPLYNPSPVFTDDVYAEYGDELTEIFDPISAALTQEEMTALNERVSVDLEDPADVAEDWLSENDFI